MAKRGKTDATESLPSMVVGNGKSNSLIRRLFFSKWSFISLAALVVVAAGVVAYIVHQAGGESIVVANTTITHKAVKDYQNGISDYASKSGEDFGTNAAQNDLILNAALKDQAKKHGITVTAADMDAYLQTKYDAYGSKQAYDDAVQATGIASQIAVRNENDLYKSKLEDILILKKQLFYIGIFYDSPFFLQSGNSSGLLKQAVTRMQTQYLPLFEKGESKEAIAAQADVNTLTATNATNDTTYHLFEKGAPVEAAVVSDYTADQPYFNDAEGDVTVPGVVSTNEAANKLTKVGDTTGVITTLGGFVGIMRLEGTTHGTYKSWDDFLNAYKTKALSQAPFHKRLAAIKLTAHKVEKSFATVYHYGSSLVGAKAGADSIFCDHGVNDSNSADHCAYPLNELCSSHKATFSFASYDTLSGASFAGVKITEIRNKPAGGGYTAAENSFGVDCGKNHAGIGTNETWPQSKTTVKGAFVTITDNCYRPPPDWNDPFDGPSGTTYLSATSNGPIDGHGVPVWSNGSINLVKDFKIRLYYKVKLTNDPPTGSIKVDCNTDGTADLSYKFADNDGDGNDTYMYARIVAAGTTPPGVSADKSLLKDASGWTRHGPGTSAAGATSTLANGSKSVWLYVYDAGPAGDHDYHRRDSQNIKCNQPPTGKITKNVCVIDPVTGVKTFTVKASYGDSDGDSTTPARAYLISGQYIHAGDVSDGDATTADRLVNADGSSAYDKATSPGYDNGTVTWTGHAWPGAFHVWLRSYDVGGGYTSSVSPGPVQVAQPVCANITCDDPTGLDDNRIVGQPLKFSVAINIAGAASAPPPASLPSFTVKVTNPSGTVQTLTTTSGVSYPLGSVPDGTFDNANNILYSQDIVFTPSAAGQYNVSWGWTAVGYTLNNATLPMTCAGQATAGYAPYFNAKGGDVSAGAGFYDSGDNCSDNLANIRSWNNDNNLPSPANNYFGAGSQFAAFATGKIQSFVTGSRFDGTIDPNIGVTSPPPYVLSFTNSPSPAGSGSYGGNFADDGSSDLPCADDYFDSNWDPDILDELPSTTTAVPDNTETDSYVGPLTLTGGNITSGHKVVLVVDGDVHINGNITYTTDPSSPTYSPPYALTDIPSLTIIASGGIYINGAVITLHGTFVAQGTNGPGLFATCTDPGSPTPTQETTLFGKCNHPLDIYGSVMAQRLHLNRTVGNIGTSSGPAESFHYTPELWVPAATGTGGICTNDCKYNAITSLAPVL